MYNFFKNTFVCRDTAKNTDILNIAKLKEPLQMDNY